MKRGQILAAGAFVVGLAVGTVGAAAVEAGDGSGMSLAKVRAPIEAPVNQTNGDGSWTS